MHLYLYFNEKIYTPSNHHFKAFKENSNFIVTSPCNVICKSIFLSFSLFFIFIHIFIYAFIHLHIHILKPSQRQN